MTSVMAGRTEQNSTLNPDGKQRSESTREIICVLIGAFLMFINGTLVNIWGNISVYVISYCYSKFGTFLDTDSTWVAGLYLSGVCIGVLLAGYLPFRSRNINLFMTITIGNSGFISLYFALEYGLQPLLFIGFAIFGVSVGIIFGIVSKVLGELTRNRRGMYISIAFAGATFGPIICNVWTSFYINPENITPDMKIGNVWVFYQSEIVEKVPFMFVILGLSCFACQTTGLFLINCRQSMKKHYQGVGNTYGSDKSEIENKNIDDLQKGNTTSSDNKSSNEFTPSQMMRTRVFYAICFAFDTQYLPRILLNNNYKLFGQVYISDDHFLTALGSSKAVAGCIARLVWGLVLDRLSIESNLIIIYTSYTILCVLLYFTPMVHPYLYFITALMLAFMVSCAAPTNVTAALTLFGVKNFEKNFGVMYIAGMLASVMTPPLFDTLLFHFGWFSMFAASGIVSSVAVIANILAFNFPNAAV